LTEDKGKPKIVPSIASMDTIASLKSLQPQPKSNHSGHNEFATKPENHTVSTEGRIALKCFISNLFSKIMYFVCSLGVGDGNRKTLCA
jgi:hypothetical protein